MRLRLPKALHWRIALAYTALIFVAMGAVSIYLVDFIRDTYIANLQTGIEQQAHLVSITAAPHIANADRLQALSRQTSEIVGAHVAIIDADGTPVADSRRIPSASQDQPIQSEVRQALVGSATHSIRIENGVETLYTAVPIRIDGRVVGAARIAMPTSQVQANISRIITAILISALLVAVLSVGTGYFVFHRTSRSVRAVAEGANRLAQGDLEHRVAASTSDETQELAEAFNAMAQTIRRMVSDLSGESSKLTAMLDTMEDGVLVIEADRRIALMNSAAERLLDVSAKDAVGAGLVETLHDHEIVQVALRALATKQMQGAEVNLLPQRRLLSAIATPLGGPGDGSILLSLHDLTGVHRLETTRREFVANVSHELRSPLTSVKMMVETLEDGALDDNAAARDFLRRINREVDRMNAMVEDLLELARLESSQHRPNLAPFDLSALVCEVASEYADRSPTVAVRAIVPPVPVIALGESAKIRQALVNLLENALKNTASGSVSVSVRAARDTADGDASHHRVCVQDTGVGIAPEHRPHVFERFYKVDRARADGGTGLGLAITRHIVQTHAGEITVQSQEGVGSTFSFTIPVASKEA